METFHHVAFAIFSSNETQPTSSPQNSASRRYTDSSSSSCSSEKLNQEISNILCHRMLCSSLEVSNERKGYFKG